MKETIGGRIAKKRSEHHHSNGKPWTQQDLADRIHVAKGTVANWEGDIQKPRGDNLHALAKALSTSVGYLLHGIDMQDGAEEEQHADGARTHDRLLDEWGLARARAVEKLIDYLDKDRPIYEKRAEAALNASKAALLEAEKAPYRGLPLSSEEIAAFVEILRRVAEVPFPDRSAGAPKGESKEGPADAPSGV